MARPIDYSKWKDIEVSDDEDDTHPNIDTPSLFKWRHEARVKRMEEFEQKKKEAEAEAEAKRRQAQELQEKIASTKSKSSMEALKKSLAEVEKEKKMVEEKVKEVQKEERLQPWNVDTISKDGFSKTLVNKPEKRVDTSSLSEEEREKRMKDFVKKYEDQIKHFGWLKKFDDSKAYLTEHNHLACEETANYLVIHCINLAMEEKFAAMEQVAHQTIAMQYLLELSKQLDIDPRGCIASFFTKIQKADPQYTKAFEDELEAFKGRIRRRAKEKVEEQMEALRQEEEEERKARLGPGGLDPVEVFASLPEILQKCFESQDIGRLQQAIREMPEEEARHHMKRCVDSGLWKPAADDPDTNPEDGFRRRTDGDDAGDGGGADGGDEPVYDTADGAGVKADGEQKET